MIVGFSNDVLFKICTFLHPSEIVRLTLTCKQFHETMKDENLWKSFCINDSNTGNIIFNDILEQVKREKRMESVWNFYAQVMEGIQKLNKISLWRMDDEGDATCFIPKMEGHAACLLLDRYAILVGKSFIYICIHIVF